MATEVAESKLDWLKWLITLVILCAGVFGYYYYEQYPILYRVLGLLGVVIVSLLIAYQTQVGKIAWMDLGDSRTKVRKVVWPTKVETWQTTLIIIVAVVLVAIFFWLLDLGIGWSLNKILGVGG